MEIILNCMVGLVLFLIVYAICGFIVAWGSNFGENYKADYLPWIPILNIIGAFVILSNIGKWAKEGNSELREIRKLFKTQSDKD